MPRFAANLTMMFTEVPERFEAAARAGFTAVEFLFPYAYYVFRLLDEMGYAGWVGCEYRPRGRTVDGLGWLRPWLTRPTDSRT